MTLDNAIAAMEATHPHVTTQKSYYVEISRVRERLELVTDDATVLQEQLEAVTGERISALEGIGAMSSDALSGVAERTREAEREPRFSSEPNTGRERDRTAVEKESEACTRERGNATAMDLGL